MGKFSCSTLEIPERESQGEDIRLSLPSPLVRKWHSAVLLGHATALPRRCRTMAFRHDYSYVYVPQRCNILIMCAMRMAAFCAGLHWSLHLRAMLYIFMLYRIGNIVYVMKRPKLNLDTPTSR